MIMFCSCLGSMLISSHCNKCVMCSTDGDARLGRQQFNHSSPPPFPPTPQATNPPPQRAPDPITSTPPFGSSPTPPSWVNGASAAPSPVHPVCAPSSLIGSHFPHDVTPLALSACSFSSFFLSFLKFCA